MAFNGELDGGVAGLPGAFCIPCTLRSSAFVYISVIQILRRSLATSGQDEAALLIRKLLRRLNIYPWVLAICWFWPTVR